MAQGNLQHITNERTSIYDEWTVPNGQTTTGSMTLTLERGVWILIGFQNWNTSVNDICNYTVATDGATRTVRSSGKNGGGATLVFPVNVTSSSATFTQNAWQNNVTSAVSRAALYAFKLI